MVAAKDRVLFNQQGVLVTYNRFVEPQGKEYRIEDIQAVELRIEEEAAPKPRVRWWYTIGGGALIGLVVALAGEFDGAWLTAGILVVLMSAFATWWMQRFAARTFKVYSVCVVFPPARGNLNEIRIIQSTSRYFSERLKLALERAMLERPARYETPV